MELIESLERMKRADEYRKYRTILSTQQNSKLWSVFSVEFSAINLSKKFTAVNGWTSVFLCILLHLWRPPYSVFQKRTLFLMSSSVQCNTYHDFVVVQVEICIHVCAGGNSEKTAQDVVLAAHEDTSSVV